MKQDALRTDTLPDGNNSQGQSPSSLASHHSASKAAPYPFLLPCQLATGPRNPTTTSPAGMSIPSKIGAPPGELSLRTLSANASFAGRPSPPAPPGIAAVASGVAPKPRPATPGSSANLPRNSKLSSPPKGGPGNGYNTFPTASWQGGNSWPRANLTLLFRRTRRDELNKHSDDPTDAVARGDSLLTPRVGRPSPGWNRRWAVMPRHQ